MANTQKLDQSPTVTIRPAPGPNPDPNLPRVTVREVQYHYLNIQGVKTFSESKGPLVESERKLIARRVLEQFHRGRYLDLADKCLGIEIVKGASKSGDAAIHKYWVPNGRRDNLDKPDQLRGSTIRIVIPFDRRTPKTRIEVYKGENESSAEKKVENYRLIFRKSPSSLDSGAARP